MNVSKILVGLVAAAIAGSSFAFGDMGGGDRNKAGMAAADKKESDRGLSRMQKHKVKKAVKKHIKNEAKKEIAEKHPEAAAAMHHRDGANRDLGRDSRNLGGNRS